MLPPVPAFAQYESAVGIGSTFLIASLTAPLWASMRGNRAVTAQLGRFAVIDSSSTLAEKVTLPGACATTSFSLPSAVFEEASCDPALQPTRPRQVARDKIIAAL